MRFCQDETLEPTYNVYIVTPSLSDMYESNVLKLDYSGDIYLIPLWHSDLSFDMKEDNAELEITCAPDLPDHMSLDNDNGLHVYIRTSVQSLLSKEFLTVDLQIKSLDIAVSCIRVTRHQTIVYKGLGIPRINEDDIYNNEDKGDIVIHIELY